MNEEDSITRLNPEPPNDGQRRPITDSPPPPPPTTDSINPHQTPTKPNPRLLAFILQALVMAVVISLFFLFVGIAAIVLIHICIAGRALHRRRHRRTTTRFSDSVDDEFDFGNVGLSLKDLRKLRSFIYGEPGVELDSTRDCSICLEGFKEGDRCRKLPACKHVFHGNCIDSWLIRVAACPICRGVVELKSEVGGGLTEASSSQYVKEVGVVEVLRRVGSISPDYGM